jgi:ATP-dependent RNA helicase DDX52/ROK1
LLYNAVTQQVEELARSVLRDPLHIVVGERNTTQHLVKQRLLFVGREAGKLLALRQLLKGGGVKPPVLVSRREMFSSLEIFVLAEEALLSLVLLQCGFWHRGSC